MITLKIVCKSLIILLILPNLTVAKEDIIMLTDDWPPYSFIDPDTAQDTGIAIEVVNLIFERLEDVNLKVLFMPWSRSLRQVQSGTVW